MRDERLNAVAEEIRTEVRKAHAGPGGKLPPVSQMARILHLSPHTVLAALKRLEEEGFLHCIRGRGCFLGARPEKALPVTPSANPHQALTDWLRNSLRDGSLELGKPLPPIKEFTHSYHLGRKAVLGIFNRLEGEGLLHKRGKTRYAGPAPKVAQPAIGHILVILKKRSHWDMLVMDPLYRGFLETFQFELERSQVQLRLGFVGTDMQRVLQRPERSGPDPEKALGFFFPFHPELFPSTQPLFQELLASRRPVVVLNRSAKSPQMRGERFFIFEPWEERAVELAAQHLVSLGHRRVGFLWMGRREDWIARRLSLLRAAGAKAAEGFQVLELQDEWVFDRLKPEEGQRYLRWLAAHGPVPVREALRKYPRPEWGALESEDQLLIGYGLPMFRALQSQVTAVVVPNDVYAEHLARWARGGHVRLGRDISLLSFDDSHQAVLHGITSVNFNYRRMGYLAAQIFIKHLKVRKLHSSKVVVEPDLTARASTGLARKAPPPLAGPLEMRAPWWGQG